MENLNGTQLEYRNSKRDNYMSLTDLVQDLTTDSLIKILPTIEKLKKQLIVMSEIEKRNELSDEDYFELLETCNGI